MPNYRSRAKVQEAGTYMLSWAAFIALAAKPMFLSTSVLVLAFSRASLWNSIVDSVPSICASCFSYLFLRFRACRAAASKGQTGWHWWDLSQNSHPHFAPMPLSTQKYWTCSSGCWPFFLCCPTLDLPPSAKLFRGGCCLVVITCHSRMPAQTQS